MKENWEVKGDYGFLLGASVTLISMLMIVVVFFSSIKSQAGWREITRTSIQCYSGGRIFFSDVIDGTIDQSTMYANVFTYKSNGNLIKITGDCLITERKIDENIKRKEEEFLKNSKQRKAIKAELEKESSQFE